MSIVILGVDLGKNSCSVVGVDAAGAVIAGWTLNPASSQCNARLCETRYNTTGLLGRRVRTDP